MAKRRADKTPPPPPAQMDPKEQADREEATKAYFGEDERHFVDFMRECVKTSVSSMLDIRTMQAECWRVFNEEEPYNFALKEDWQSRVTYPKPYKLVQAGSAAIRKIFEMEFLSAENKLDPDGAIFWKITNGRPPMASYKLALKDSQRWQLVNYIRELGKVSVKKK